MSKIEFKKLIHWSESHYSHLPWRSERTLYRTLVSEIMLQQTTVSTVMNHFEIFLKQYPTLKKLAQASEEEILISWKGLGYYRRAKNLLKICKQIQEKFKGSIPTNTEELLSLNGIGPYTANALVAIGANKSGLAVDANLERVLARFYGVKELKGPTLQKKLHSLFQEKKILKDLSSLGPRKMNEALMDLGRVYCQARKASCQLCPLNPSCVAQKNEPLDYPVDSNKNLSKKNDHKLVLLRIVVIDKDQLLVYKKNEKEWLAGQWELPTFVISSTDGQFTQYPTLVSKLNFKNCESLKTSITKYSIENKIYTCSFTEFKKLKLQEAQDFVFKNYKHNLNLSTASIKALKKISISKE